MGIEARVVSTYSGIYFSLHGSLHFIEVIIFWKIMDVKESAQVYTT